MDLDLALADAYARNNTLVAELAAAHATHRQHLDDQQRIHDAQTAALRADLDDTHRLLADARRDAAYWRMAFNGYRRLARQLTTRLTELQAACETHDYRPQGGWATHPAPVTGARTVTFGGPR